MLSVAAFIFLVAIPIWSVASILTRWIESWADVSDEEMINSLISATGETAQRIAALETVLREEKSGLGRVTS